MNIFKNNRRLSYLTLWLQNNSITLISTTPGRHLQVLRSDFPSQPHCHCGHFFHSVTEIFFPSNLFHCLIPDPNHLMSRQFPVYLPTEFVCFCWGLNCFQLCFQCLYTWGWKPPEHGSMALCCLIFPQVCVYIINFLTTCCLLRFV